MTVMSCGAAVARSATGFLWRAHAATAVDSVTLSAPGRSSQSSLLVNSQQSLVISFKDFYSFRAPQVTDPFLRIATAVSSLILPDVSALPSLATYIQQTQRPQRGEQGPRVLRRLYRQL